VATSAITFNGIDVVFSNDRGLTTELRGGTD
jgi:hypothetical protein